MLDLVDEISELVYVVDLHNYDLLYLNEIGKKSFGISDVAGMKCYAALQNRDTPCDFCTNRLLKRNEEYTWKYKNPVTGRYYFLKDKLILWGGREVRLEVALDITEQELQKEEIQKALDREILIVECIKCLHEYVDITVAMPKILEKIGEFLSAERVYTFRIADGLLHNTYEWCAEGIEPQIENLQNLDLSLIERWQGEFLKRGHVLVEDIEMIRLSSPEEYEILSMQNIHSLVVVPLEIDGQMMGFIGVDNPPLDKMKLISSMIYALSYFISSKVKRAETEKKLFKLSYYDMLTNFYNRNKFTADVAAIKSKQKRCTGVIYVDINGLKEVNDRYGHQRGDEIICEAADKTRSIFSGQNFYRVGGDELVVFYSLPDKVIFDEQVSELKNAFRHSRECKAAIGAVWGDEEADVDRMIAAADERMYDDKKRFYRKNALTGRYRHYNDDLLGLAKPGALEKRLREGRFNICLQPKVTLPDGAMFGAEALVRYQSLEHGTILPDQFVSLLESSGMIRRVDFYVFEMVLRLMTKWSGQGKKLFPISVNFSQRTIADHRFLKDLEAVWGAYSLPKELFVLEIMDRSETEKDEHLLLKVRQIKQRGFAVSIDDFGMRYANLSLLASVDVDEIKMDQSLLNGFQDGSKAYFVIDSIVQLCKKIGVRTLMEGVETLSDYTLLKRIGCDCAQGYLFSRPLSIGEFENKYL